MDEFRWLEDGNDPAVRKWTDTQNRRTESGKALTAAADPAFHHLKAFDLAPHQDKLVINTGGIVKLGELLAHSYLEHTAEKRGNSR